jgi:hypothetical protein
MASQIGDFELKMDDERNRRVVINLGEEERRQLKAVLPFPGRAFEFWRKACDSRGLDMSTALVLPLSRNKVSALPYGHSKYWCWPELRKCKKPNAGS